MNGYQYGYRLSTTFSLVGLIRYSYFDFHYYLALSDKSGPNVFKVELFPGLEPTQEPKSVPEVMHPKYPETDTTPSVTDVTLPVTRTLASTRRGSNRPLATILSVAKRAFY